jgi:hypothetical protein
VLRILQNWFPEVRANNFGLTVAKIGKATLLAKCFSRKGFTKIQVPCNFSIMFCKESMTLYRHVWNESCDCLRGKLSKLNKRFNTGADNMFLNCESDVLYTFEIIFRLLCLRLVVNKLHHAIMLNEPCHCTCRLTCR